MTAPLARYLKDFTMAPPPPPVASPVEDMDFGGTSFDFEPTFDATPPVDVEAERAEAFAAGKAEGEAEARQAFDAERDEMKAAHAREIEELRQQLERNAIDRIEAQFRDLRDHLAHMLEDKTAAVLVPVLQDALATKAVNELADMIRDALATQDVTRLTAHGSRAMFDRLAEALGPDGPELRHVETQDLDISVDIQEAVLVTRLSAWAGSVKKVLG